LTAYKVVYVTEPNIPVEFQKRLLEWVRGGGTLVTVTGAGAYDRYDDPCNVLADGVGLAETPRERMFIAAPDALQESGQGVAPQGRFVVFGPRGAFANIPKEGILARFDDGAPAVVERRVGLGRVVHFTWMPGLSYFKSSTAVKDRLPVGFSETLREMILHPVRTAGVAPPVQPDRALVEAPLLLSPKGAAVTLLNWTGESLPQVTVAAHLPFAAQSVESVKRGKLPFQRTTQGVSFTLPLDAADIVLLRP